MSRFKTNGIITGPEHMVIVRRKGRKIRYQNTVTGAFSRWTTDPLTPRKATSLPETAVYNVPEFTVEALGTTTVATLRDMAKARGIKVPSKARKADIIAALTN